MLNNLGKFNLSNRNNKTMATETITFLMSFFNTLNKEAGRTLIWPLVSLSERLTLSLRCSKKAKQINNNLWTNLQVTFPGPWKNAISFNNSEHFRTLSRLSNLKIMLRCLIGSLPSSIAKMKNSRLKLISFKTVRNSSLQQLRHLKILVALQKKSQQGSPCLRIKLLKNFCIIKPKRLLCKTVFWV